MFNPLNVKLNPICHLLALLGTHHILHVSRISVKTRLHNARNSSRIISPWNLPSFQLVQFPLCTSSTADRLWNLPAAWNILYTCPLRRRWEMLWKRRPKYCHFRAFCVEVKSTWWYSDILFTWKASLRGRYAVFRKPILNRLMRSVKPKLQQTSNNTHLNSNAYLTSFGLVGEDTLIIYRRNNSRAQNVLNENKRLRKMKYCKTPRGLFRSKSGREDTIIFHGKHRNPVRPRTSAWSEWGRKVC